MTFVVSSDVGMTPVVDKADQLEICISDLDDRVGHHILHKGEIRYAKVSIHRRCRACTFLAPRHTDHLTIETWLLEFYDGILPHQHHLALLGIALQLAIRRAAVLHVPRDCTAVRRCPSLRSS